MRSRALICLTKAAILVVALGRVVVVAKSPLAFQVAIFKGKVRGGGFEWSKRLGVGDPVTGGGDDGSHIGELLGNRYIATGEDNGNMDCKNN